MAPCKGSNLPFSVMENDSIIMSDYIKQISSAKSIKEISTICRLQMKWSFDVS